MIQIRDKKFVPFINAVEIKAEVASLAETLNKEYEGKDVIFIAILNGAFMFASDLFKEIDLPSAISFIKVSSYSGMNTTGRVDEIIGLMTSIKDKHVVIIEDIVDTGITIEKVKKLSIVHFCVKKLKSCAISENLCATVRSHLLETLVNRFGSGGR